VTPPTALANLDAEKTVLGCALAGPDSLFRVMPLLTAQDFSLDWHRRIFQTISDLAEGGKPVDELTLTSALGAKGEIERTGGVAYISSLTDQIDAGMARVTNVERYCEIVKDKARRRRAHAAAKAMLDRAEDASVSTDECLEVIQDALLEIQSASGKANARHGKEIMPNVLMELEKQSLCQGVVGMPTGLHSLDTVTGGIRLGELWTVGALTGRGKTAIGLQFALESGAAGTPVVIFSLEMAQTEIGKRFLAAWSQFSAHQIRNPQLIPKNRWVELAESAAEISELPIYVDDRPSLKIRELIASARLYVRRHGAKLVIIDYLRMVRAPGRELREQVGNIADACREFAKTEKVGVVLLSQLKRPDGGINAKPSMLDLKESGDIEAHSHVVLLPYLPVAEDGKPSPDKQELIIGKNRNGGIGSLPVYLDDKKLQFRERDTRDSRQS
jgi:replicative DNA helicase